MREDERSARPRAHHSVYDATLFAASAYSYRAAAGPWLFASSFRQLNLPRSTTYVPVQGPATRAESWRELQPYLPSVVPPCADFFFTLEAASVRLYLHHAKDVRGHHPASAEGGRSSGCSLDKPSNASNSGAAEQDEKKGEDHGC